MKRYHVLVYHLSKYTTPLYYTSARIDKIEMLSDSSVKLNEVQVLECIEAKEDFLLALSAVEPRDRP